MGTLVGCGGGDSDASLYTRALTQAASYDDARRLCDRIRDPGTRGDCQVASMESWGRLDPAECVALAQGAPELALWRDECMFQLAERLRAAGDLDGALAACVDTRFARQCAWHLVQDEAEASLDEPPPRAEQRLSRFSGIQRLPDAPMQFWLVRFRAAAAAGTPPAETVCAGLSAPEPCYDALGRSVRLVLDARHRADRVGACGSLSEDGAKLDMRPSWSPGPRANAYVDQWRAQRCRVDAPLPLSDP